MREFLHNIEVFRGLSDSSIQRIAAAIEEVSLPMDTSLFREGEPADALFISRAGSVRVMKQPPPGGVAIVVAHMPAGTVIGERDVLDGTVRAASVVTNTPSVFWKLQRSTVQALAAEDPLIWSRVHALASGHLHTPHRELTPEGDAGIEMLGHRDYVGGLWEEIGQLQFHFLVAQGLTPSHCLLDIGCGALRGGVHFIQYLDPGNYLGLEKEQTLITLGIEKELGVSTYTQKQPEFVISACFEFHKFSKTSHFSIAQSLFTHLNPEDIRCSRRARSERNAGWDTSRNTATGTR